VTEITLSALVTELHQVVRRYERDRWFFLRSWSVPPAARRKTLWHVPLMNAVADGLACTIRADYIPSDHTRSVPVISVDFGRLEEGRQLTIRVDDDGEVEAHVRPVEGAQRQLTIRVGLDAQGRHRWPLGVKSLAPLSPEWRRFWLKGARAWRAKKPASGSQVWRISPRETPEKVTLAVFLLYLWRAGLINLEPVGESWAAVRAVTSRRVDDTELWMGLDKMRSAYALPQHWQEFRKYLGRTLNSVRERPAEGPWVRLGINRATWYRWRAEGLTEEQMEQRAEARAERVSLLTGLMDRRGMTAEAARKALYRRRLRANTGR
jgi:hypothetical protein